MKKIFIFFIIVKFILFSTLIFSYFSLPHQAQMYQSNFIYPAGEKFEIASIFKTWDGQRYIYLGVEWYKHAGISQISFPLLPLFILCLTSLGINGIVAGYIVATLCSFGFIYFFYKFVEKLWGKEIAYMGSIFAITFPSAFYLSRIYTESVFLLFTAIFFYLLVQKKYMYAGLVSLLIPLSRPMGFLIVIPFFVWLFYDVNKKKIKVALPSFAEKVCIILRPDYLALTFPIVGFGIYFLIMKIFAGGYLSGFSQLDSYSSAGSFANLLSPGVFIKAFYDLSHNPHVSTDIIDRALFVMFLISLPFIYKLLGKVWFVYSLVFGSVFLLGSFEAFHRYVYTIFPMFIVLAVILKKKKWEAAYLPISYVFLSFQILLHILHGLNYWVF